MKLREIMKNVKTGDSGIDFSLDFQELAEVIFGSEVYSWDIDYTKFYEDEPLKLWGVCPVYDTDSYVGESVLMMNETPVAWVYQKGRKTDIKYKFVKETFNDLKGLILTFKKETIEDNVDFLSDKDLDSSESTTYKVYFPSELMVFEGYYQEKPVSIEKILKQGFLGQEVLIKTQEGEVFRVSIEEVDLKILINNP